MRICAVGDSEDLSLSYLGWLAERRGIEVVMLREDRLGLDWWFALETDRGRGSITLGDRTFGLAEISGAFVRLNPEPGIDDEIGLDATLQPVYALERRHGLHWLLDTAPFTVVNRPWAGRSNGSKPYQMALLSAAGLHVPEWIVTSDAEVARSFMSRWRDGAVYKSCSGLRSHVRRADEALLARLDEGTTPVVLQRYVPGVDVRIHTVRTRTFATEVRSDSVDYRFDSAGTTYAPTDVPPRITLRSTALAAAEGLELAGLDFRRDAHGQWWCLEMNPVPTFLPYEAAAGHPIGDAILDLLAGRDTTTIRRSPLAEIEVLAASPR